MTKNQLQNVINSIKSLRRHRSRDIHRLYLLGNEIEYEKNKKFEYEILNKTKHLKKIKRKLRRNRLLMQRYLRKIRRSRKKLKKKVRLKQKVERKVEVIRQRKARRLQRLRKLRLMRRLVREKRLMRLKQMAELRKSDRRRYAIELRAQKRRQNRSRKRLKRESAATKKFRRKLKETKEKRRSLEWDISSIRASLDNWRKKRSTLKKHKKSLMDQLSDFKEPVVLKKGSSKKVSKISMGSVKSTKRKPTTAVGLTPSTSTGISMEKSSASFIGLSSKLRKDNKFIPLKVLMGRKALTSKEKGRKEPWPVGDSRFSERKSRFSSKRRKLKTRKSSPTTTSGLGTATTTSATASDSEYKLSRTQKADLQKGDISTQSSQVLSKGTENLSSLYRGVSGMLPQPVQVKKSKLFHWGNRPKKSTMNLAALRRSFRKLKGKRRDIKAVSFKRPVDLNTLRSIHIERGSKDYYNMPRHSTSKPSYADDKSPITTDHSETEEQASIYDENYYKSLVRKQTKVIRELLKTERKLKIAQKQKLLEEEEQRRREQREQEARKKQTASTNHDKELERLVQAGLRSQFNLFDIIPDETPVINEEILKMAERGKRINIRDLMPTSSIFDWPVDWLAPSETAKSSRSKGRKRFKKKSTKSGTSKKRRSTLRRKSKVSTFSQDSDESNEELISAVTVEKFQNAPEHIEDQISMEEDLKQESVEEMELSHSREKSIRKIQRRHEMVDSKEEPKIVVVCSACGMTNMEPGGGCCKLEPKKIVDA